MKLSETMKSENGKRIYRLLAILCLIYGGVALILFVNQAYSVYIREQFEPALISTRNLTLINSTALGNSAILRNVTNEYRAHFRNSFAIPLVVNFIGSLLSIIVGASLLHLLRVKEIKEIKREVIDTIILPDEKIVIKELQNNKGALAQSEIVTATGLSKVKIHRIVKRLESLGIVKKYPYGVTNKIKLEKELWDE